MRKQNSVVVQSNWYDLRPVTEALLVTGSDVIQIARKRCALSF